MIIIEYAKKVHIIYDLNNVIIKHNISYEEAYEMFDFARYATRCDMAYDGKSPKEIVVENNVGKSLQEYYGISNEDGSTENNRPHLQDESEQKPNLIRSILKRLRIRT